MELADDFADNKKAKEATPKHEKVMTIVNWVITVICVVLIVFALVVAIFTIVRSTNGESLTKFGSTIYMNVMSDSMQPTFSQKDIIIAKEYKGDGKDLKVGQVITFSANIGGYEGFNTHRIVYIQRDEDGNVSYIKTRGDNCKDENGNIIPWQDSLVQDGDDFNVTSVTTGPDGTWDPTSVTLTGDRYKVVATWGSVDENGNFHNGKMLKGCGAFANWLQDREKGKTRFFCVIVLPLIILFIAYAFVLVRTLVIARLENNKKVKGEPVRDVDSMSDEEKRRLASELLASLQASEQPVETSQSEEVPEGETAGESEPAEGEVANAEEAAENSEAVEDSEAAEAEGEKDDGAAE